MALTTFQDLMHMDEIMHDLSEAVATQDLPSWRLAHPLCAAGAAELINCLKLSAQQLAESTQHPFVGLQHVSRVECDTRQLQYSAFRMAPVLPSWTASLPLVVAKLPKLVYLKVRFHDPLPVPVGGYSMLTRLDLQFERPPFSAGCASRMVESADALPPGVSLPALKAASFMGGHLAGVNMQAAHIAAFALQLQQLHVWTLRITPAAGASAGKGRDPSSSSSSGAAGPSVLPSCTHLACTNVVVGDIESDQQFAAAFAAAFPVLEVVALLPRFLYKPGGSTVHKQVPSAAVLSCCTSLRAIRNRRVGHRGQQWSGGDLSSLAALTQLTRLEVWSTWFDTAAVTELGVLTSLRALCLSVEAAKVIKALPVMQQLPHLQL